MKLKIVVLAKQVPDTRNVGKDAMTEEGTVNRAALPAIFNPEDLNALEQALRLKEQNPGSTVGVLTMGPPRAGEIIRQGLYRGADTGWLLTDRLFAGADTLATSYALATAIQKIGDVDVVIGGRQAIDGELLPINNPTGGNPGNPDNMLCLPLRFSQVPPSPALPVHSHMIQRSVFRQKPITKRPAGRLYPLSGQHYVFCRRP